MTFACPLCTVILPRELEDPSHAPNFVRHLTIVQGAHSKLFFLVRPLCCSHGPEGMPTSSDNGPALAEAWGNWARQEALKKAERLQYTPMQRGMFLYHLGLEPHPMFKTEKP